MKIFAEAIFGWSFRVTIIFFNQFSGEFSRAQLGRFRGPLWMTFWMPFREPFGKHFGSILGCNSGHVFGSILGALWGCNRTLWGCNTAPRDTQSPRTSPRSSPEAFRGSQATRLTLILTRRVLSSHATGPGSVPAGCGHPCWHENWCPCAQSWLQGNRLCLVRHQEFGCI